MNGAKAFVDTDILLYLYSSADKAKRDRARRLIRELRDRDQVVISTQVVQEFNVNASRLQMDRSDLEAATSALFELPLIVVNQNEIRSAIALENRYGINFWDALIVAASGRDGRVRHFIHGGLESWAHIRERNCAESIFKIAGSAFPNIPR
jgi:predicted nucleic acid-binding protein